MPVSAASRPTGNVGMGHGSPPGQVFAGSLLILLKPWLKGVVRPVARRLVGLGLTANQVTLLSLMGSLATSAAMASDPLHPALFALLPAWQVLRALLAALDGAMAVEFGQKSRIGGVLNEVGDVVSDVVLVAPFAALSGFTPELIGLVVTMALAVEGVGIAGEFMGSGRQLEGPFGKVDRATAFGLLGLWVGLCPPDPVVADNACLLALALLLVTLSNRLDWVVAGVRRHAGRAR